MLGTAVTREPSLASKIREIFGTDWSWSAADIAALRQAGVGFGCRYVSNDPGKNITLGEAQALTAAGISIVTNWESTQYRPEEGYAAGAEDARRALTQALAAGMPLGRPIYFSIDYDGTVGPNITGYFQGAASVLGVACVGAYGSRKVIGALFDKGLIRWGWQTYAWSYGAWDPRAHIRQYLNSQKIGRMDVDFNESMAPDFGQWMVGRKAPSDGPVVVTPGADPHNPDFQRMVRACQQDLNFRGTAVDGIWGPATEEHGELVRQAGLHGPTAINVRALQGEVLGFSGRDIDGVVGPKTLAGWVQVCRNLQAHMFVPVDGVWGTTTDAAYRVMSPYV